MPPPGSHQPLEFGPLPVQSHIAVADQFRASQPDPSEVDSNANGLPDQIEAGIQTDAILDRDGNGVLDIAESRGPVEASKGNREMLDSLAVVDWDLNANGVHDAMDADYAAAYGSMGINADRNGNKIPDILESRDPPLETDRERRELVESLAIAEWDLDGDGIPNVLDGTPLKRAGSEKPLDLTGVPTPRPSRLNAETIPTPVGRRMYKAPPRLKTPSPSPRSSSGRGRRERRLGL